MADLAIGISKTVVEDLVKKVNNAIKEEKVLWKIVERDTLFMKAEFEMMQSFLKTADWEQVKNTVGRTWVSQVRELSYDAEDSVDAIVHLDTKRSLWTIWRRFWASCNCNCGAPSELELAVDAINFLKARVEEVCNRNKRYSLINNYSCSMVATSQQLACVPAIGTTAAVDILTKAWSTEQKLGGSVNLSMLINESCESLRVITLWGTRGDLGVTSIIKEAFEEEVVRQKFKSRAWLKLAHPFTPNQFIKRLAEQFYVNSCKDVGESITEVAKRRDHVKEFVQFNKHRYLVIIEDLSNMSDWQAVRTCLPYNKNGSRIVVSTQKLEIARLCAGQSYQVSELSKLPDNHSICAFFNECFKRVEVGIVHNGSSLEQSAESDLLDGRNSDEKELSELVSSARHGHRPCVICVWGFPGVGNSALVKSVWSRQESFNEEQFFKLYVDVSYPFSLAVLCRRMLSYTSKEAQQDGASRPVPEKKIADEQIINECTEFLKNNRGIVVIDGLRAKEDWDSIKKLIPEPSQTSSIIVVVTAEESVAKYCTERDDSVYRVKALAADDAIKLFEKNFQRGRTFRDNVYMKKEADYILIKCGGIPKVIMAIARYLGAQQGDTRQRKLSHLKANFIHELETNPEFVSLRDLFSWMHFKFDALPWCLKRCILYESVFSEAKRIGMRPSHFVRRWIAEGYSKCTNSKTMEEYTADLFSKLTKETASMVFSEVKRIGMRPSHFVRRWIAEGYSKCTNSKTVEEYASDLFSELTKETASMGTSLRWMDDRDLPAKEELTPSSFSSGTLAYCLCKFLGCRPDGIGNGIKVPAGIRHLKALSTLGVVNVNTAKGKDILADIRQLKQLKKLELSGIKPKNSKYLSKAVINQTNLESLSLQVVKENRSVRWDGISLPSSIRSLKLYGHLDMLSAMRFNKLRNLRKLSLEMTKLLTEKDLQILGSVQSLITLRLRVDNTQDGKLQFPPHLPANEDQSHGQNQQAPASPPVNNHQADGEHQAPDHLPVNHQADGQQQVPGRLFSKLQGSYGDTLQEALQKQLDHHPKKPALKLQVKTQSPSSQASRQ
nr:unnamed protein product [Digitaria exilis]